ncbi:MAG: S-layer homology domain-containing protein, partial [Oscillospiraceae bacterium]|nr:S-layer homology domain-containing protein [Oscillospiraceae bacterium]
LRLTQLNNFTADEVAIAGGMMPRKGANAVLPETFDYLLVKREGENLDSLYTTVLEPYRNTRYIEKIERCNVSGVDSSDPTVSAVKITHTGGKRVDYIVYSEDNTKTFTVDGLFTFRGFVGVYSVNNNGQVINRYVNDGDIISADGSSDMAYGAYTGKVIDFDKEMEFEDFENYIDIEISEKPIDDELLADIKGRWIYIENDGAENAAYEIVDTEKLSDNEVRLHTGNVTNIRGYVDSYNTEKGYVYNFAENDSCRIPLSFIDDSSPIFDSVGALTTSAGSSISVTVKAKSPITVDPPTISYVAQTLPRGASLNTETGTVTWKPDDSQGGDNHFAITARDSDGRESTLHFIVTVYGRTTGKPSTDEEQTTDNSGTSGEGAPSGGGGGGGGGAAPAPDKEDAPVGGGGSDVPQDDDKTGGEENAPDASGETDSIRFTDLGSHSWAADAINELAADGIIKGTTASTFSPASNITRADFALLLVRAFKLTSDNAENFADVTASDYFASELAIARNTGIVGGIGNNKFAPRNPITRQDMMVIVYRALTTQSDENDNADGYASKPSLPKGGGTAEWRWEDTNNGEISSYPDFSTVAPYARDAVSALISAGLVNGKNGKIDPAAYTTRAEVAVLVKRILDYVK